MEGADLELVCLCGYENFERIFVRRVGREPLHDCVTRVGLQSHVLPSGVCTPYVGRWNH